MSDLSLRCTAFAGHARIASGELRHVALKARQAHAAGKPVLVFEDASGRQLDLPLELPEGELLRRLAAHGQSTVLLARRLEIAYRKPCFAGERVRFHLQAYVDGDRAGAIVVLLPDGQGEARPYCFLHLTLTA